MTAMAPDLEGLPDRDELLGGVVSLQTVLRVLAASLRTGAVLGAAESEGEVWEGKAALLSLLEVTRWHGEALLAVARSSVPHAASAQLRPIVEAWMRLEALLSRDATDDALDDEVAMAAVSHAAIARIPDAEWRDDLVDALEASRMVLPHRMHAVRTTAGRLTVVPAEDGVPVADRVAFLASRVITRSWAVSFEALGLPVVPAAVWDGTAL